MKGSGNCKIAGVELGELNVDFFAPRVLPSAKYAYVGEGEQRFGSSYRNQWSGEVMSLLASLKQAMEREICAELFGGSEDAPSSEAPTPDSGIPSL